MKKFLQALWLIWTMYTNAKRKLNQVWIFSDLERYSLDILRQEDGLLAAEIRAGYDYIFVDEYQDTNPVQEEILSLVSAQDNLFSWWVT